jgi:hypothetical protein
VHDAELVLQLEYAEHKDDCKLETVAYSELGQAEDTQLATAAVLVHWEDQAEVYVEKAEDKQDCLISVSETIPSAEQIYTQHMKVQIPIQIPHHQTHHHQTHHQTHQRETGPKLRWQGQARW